MMATLQANGIRLATASLATKPTTAETLDQTARIAKEAAKEKADILLLPEAYIGGYPRGTNFGSCIGARTQEGRNEYLKYFSQAVDLGDSVNDGAGEGNAWVRREIGLASEQAVVHDGEDTETTKVDGDGTREELERIAKETGVFLVAGLIERVGGSLYCAVVYVCPKLGMIGKRRKVMPTGTERLIWGQGSPATLKAVSTVIRGTRINLAAAICWENYMPLLRQSLYTQNINLYLAPTADGRDTWLPLMRTIGIEGRCFVVSSNMCVRKGRYGDSRRRKSHHQIVTDEYGNEIVLPTATTTGTRDKGRSMSSGHRVVTDEYGNEIVLPTDADDTGALDETLEAAPSTENVPAVLSGDPTPKDFVSRGGSCIVSPSGEVLAGPQWEDDEGIIYADVDFQDCIRGRLDLDVAGSYSSKDLVEGIKKLRICGRAVQWSTDVLHSERLVARNQSLNFAAEFLLQSLTGDVELLPGLRAPALRMKVGPESVQDAGEGPVVASDHQLRLRLDVGHHVGPDVPVAVAIDYFRVGATGWICR
ncbi:carbon-nitrogen hydrolase [Zalerion maritima]|uniref:Carbon-nitrogen hydrolase n=1 Tax=Zalerion maritima TaxID=339359 RepID=A0AAD5S156_9PEZI|nr:carbon-nitrogen hydrolase [Zalerion maritima]